MKVAPYRIFRVECCIHRLTSGTLAGSRPVWRGEKCSKMTLAVTIGPCRAGSGAAAGQASKTWPARWTTGAVELQGKLIQRSVRFQT